VSRGPVALAVLVPAILLGGCVVGTSTMNVGYDEAKAARGPLSAVGSRRIRIDVTDRRPLPGEVIGYNLGGAGFSGLQTYGPIAAPRPVREIVQNALAAELRKNNHVVVTGEADRSLTVDVREFSVNMQQGFWSMRFSGATLIHMAVADGRTGQALLTRDYRGGAVEHGQTSFKGNWKAAMNDALEAMVRDVATDPRLVEALGAP
jgi:uncharacterized lipoprotein YajG